MNRESANNRFFIFILLSHLNQRFLHCALDASDSLHLLLERNSVLILQQAIDDAESFGEHGTHEREAPHFDVTFDVEHFGIGELEDDGRDFLLVVRHHSLTFASSVLLYVGRSKYRHPRNPGWKTFSLSLWNGGSQIATQFMSLICHSLVSPEMERSLGRLFPRLRVIAVIVKYPMIS